MRHGVLDAALGFVLLLLFALAMILLGTWAASVIGAVEAVNGLMLS